MLHSHLLDMFRAFSNPPNTSNVRPQQGSKLSKPPWFQFIDFARSWSEKTLLSDGFLLESSPWHNESNSFYAVENPLAYNYSYLHGVAFVVAIWSQR
jgi:hypothetical protein